LQNLNQLLVDFLGLDLGTHLFVKVPRPRDSELAGLSPH